MESALKRGCLGFTPQLHTVAAYYPEVADFQHRRSARSLVQSIAKLYPCSHCKDDFAQAIDHHPPKCDTNHTCARRDSMGAECLLMGCRGCR
jgi:hypothetical protein